MTFIIDKRQNTVVVVVVYCTSPRRCAWNKKTSLFMWSPHQFVHLLVQLYPCQSRTERLSLCMGAKEKDTKATCQQIRSDINRCYTLHISTLQSILKQSSNKIELQIWLKIQIQIYKNQYVQVKFILTTQKERCEIDWKFNPELVL